jgi:kynurenine formamidase
MRSIYKKISKAAAPVSSFRAWKTASLLEKLMNWDGKIPTEPLDVDDHFATPEGFEIKGEATVTLEAADVFAEAGIDLVGNESQTVGPIDAPMQVHLRLLSENIVLLEGIRLSDVPDGVYFLNAAPINLGGADGAPVRAILIEF